MKTNGVVGCLQIGQVTRVGSCQADHPDEFYLEKLKEVCLKAGLGAIERVRGRAVWSMAPYLGKDNACRLESLQGKSNIFHCSDYMYPSSMSHAMGYAARLAKAVAKMHGCEIPLPRLLGSRRFCSASNNFREFAVLKADLARGRRCSAAPSVIREDNDASTQEVKRHFPFFCFDAPCHD